MHYREAAHLQSRYSDREGSKVVLLYLFSRLFIIALNCPSYWTIDAATSVSPHNPCLWLVDPLECGHMSLVAYLLCIEVCIFCVKQCTNLDTNKKRGHCCLLCQDIYSMRSAFNFNNNSKQRHLEMWPIKEDVSPDDTSFLGCLYSQQVLGWGEGGAGYIFWFLSWTIR